MLVDEDNVPRFQPNLLYTLVGQNTTQNSFYREIYGLAVDLENNYFQNLKLVNLKNQQVLQNQGGILMKSSFSLFSDNKHTKTQKWDCSETLLTFWGKNGISIKWDFGPKFVTNKS